MEPSTSTGTVLVVDDQPEIRQGIERLLRRAGFGVATAGDGAQALTYLEQHPPPCLILLDLLMPVMDGWQFLRIWGEDRSLSAIPVVVCSSETVPECWPETAHLAGFQPKPVDGDELLTLLDQFRPPAVP